MQGIAHLHTEETPVAFIVVTAALTCWVGFVSTVVTLALAEDRDRFDVWEDE